MEIATVDNKASITLKAAYKEHEGVYTVRLRTWDDVQEHSSYVYVKGKKKLECVFDVNAAFKESD